MHLASIRDDILVGSRKGMFFYQRHFIRFGVDPLQTTIILGEKSKPEFPPIRLRVTDCARAEGFLVGLSKRL
jgi:hypothetical protein